MSAEVTDQMLVERVQRGDRLAFDLLVRKYQHKVVKLVGRFVRNTADAEDIAQEAFIKAYRALPAFRGDSAFYTWLYRIAINTAKNAVVSNRRRPLELDVDTQDAEQFERHAQLREGDTPEGLALAEEIRLQQGKEQSALLYAMVTLTAKVAAGLAVFLAFGLLSRVGYDPQLGKHNAPAAIESLVLVYAIGPVSLNLLGMACMRGYSLTRARAADIRRRLEARDAGLQPS